MQAQAAQVERIGNRLIEVGASDFLRERPAPLTPGLEGYEIALTLKNETAALASGRPFEASSCGGRI